MNQEMLVQCFELTRHCLQVTSTYASPTRASVGVDTKLLRQESLVDGKPKYSYCGTLGRRGILRRVSNIYPTAQR